jgi:hypothetical protein
MINLMYVIVLNLVNVEENILNFVVLIHYMVHVMYEQTKLIFYIKKKHRIKFENLRVYQHDQENY